MQRCRVHAMKLMLRGPVAAARQIVRRLPQPRAMRADRARRFDSGRIVRDRATDKR